jgi:hypothetical protein
VTGVTLGRSGMSRGRPRASKTARRAQTVARMSAAISGAESATCTGSQPRISLPLVRATSSIRMSNSHCFARRGRLRSMSYGAPSRPVFTSATGQAVLPVPSSPKGRCGTHGKRPLPRPPASQAGIPQAIRKSTAHGRWPGFNEREVVQAEPGPRTQPFACVPHADGFVGLLDVPGMATCAGVPPFVRAVARTCTRAVRSLCRGPPESLFGL